MTPFEISQALSLDPSRPAPCSAPPVDDIRPVRCPHCSAASKRGRSIVLEGHGVRQRPVVTVRLRDGLLGLLREKCWARRFLCNACGRSTVVLPEGVVPGQLFSVHALVWNWLQLGLVRGSAQPTAAPPAAGSVGGREVCAPTGVDLPEPSVRRPSSRSSYRWLRTLAPRWLVLSPSGPGWREHLRRVLVELAVRAASWEPIAIMRQAVAIHGRYGAAG
jgi:hypothetical protein